MDGAHRHFTVRKAGSEYERRTKIAPIDIAGRFNRLAQAERAVISVMGRASHTAMDRMWRRRGRKNRHEGR